MFRQFGIPTRLVHLRRFNLLLHHLSERKFRYKDARKRIKCWAQLAGDIISFGATRKTKGLFISRPGSTTCVADLANRVRKLEY